MKKTNKLLIVLLAAMLIFVLTATLVPTKVSAINFSDIESGDNEDKTAGAEEDDEEDDDEEDLSLQVKDDKDKDTNKDADKDADKNTDTDKDTGASTYSKEPLQQAGIEDVTPAVVLGATALAVIGFVAYKKMNYYNV